MFVRSYSAIFFMYLSTGLITGEYFSHMSFSFRCYQTAENAVYNLGQIWFYNCQLIRSNICYRVHSISVGVVT